MPIIDDLAGLLNRPGFWRSYYGSRLAQTDDDPADEFLSRAFIDDPDFDYEALWGPDPYDAVTDDMDEDESDEAMAKAMAAGSILPLPLPNGATWTIEFSSSPGIDHRLTLVEPDERSIGLGYDDPHFHLPILRWSEAVRVAAAFQEPFPTTFGLALLAPVVWRDRSVSVEEARELLERSWAATGLVKPEHVKELAERLVVSYGVTWRPDPVFGWVNDGRHSHRNPAAGYWQTETVLAFRGFLDGLASSGRPATHRETAPDASVVWRVETDGPADPVLTVVNGRLYCATTNDGKLRALDVATGEHYWFTGIMDRGLGRNEVTIYDGRVLYAGGSESLDLVRFADDGSGEVAVDWVHSLEEGGTRYGPVGSYAGFADTTPVVADGWVIVVENRVCARRLTADGVETGWNVPLYSMDARRTRPVVAGSRVHFGIVRDGGDKVSLVHSIELETGEMAREPFAEVAGVIQDLRVDGDALFVAAADLTALDTETAAVRWTARTEREWCGSIAVTSDLVVGTTCRSASDTAGPEWRYVMTAVDRTTGSVVWTFDAPGRLASSGVVVDGGFAYSVGYDDRDATVYAVEVATGELRWQYPLGRSTCLPGVTAGTVFVSSADGSIIALRSPV